MGPSQDCLEPHRIDTKTSQNTPFTISRFQELSTSPYPQDADRDKLRYVTRNHEIALKLLFSKSQTAPNRHYVKRDSRE